jgi:hypothetical protein
MSSAAETRFEIAALPSARIPAAAGRDLPGPFACGARLVKARLTFPRDGPPEAADGGRIVRLEWRSEDLAFHEDLAFDDPPISLSLVAASGDGPRPASQSR